MISQESLERERALGRARRSGGGYGGTPQGFLAAPLVAPAWLLTRVRARPRRCANMTRRDVRFRLFDLFVPNDGRYQGVWQQRACWQTENQCGRRPYIVDPDAALKVATCMTQAAEPLSGAAAL